MANLSNINNVLRVSSDLRVGINTDAASYALEIGGTNSGIKLKNSGGSGKVYSLLSDTSGNFQIYDDAAASGRLVIAGNGYATFASRVNAGESFGALKDGADTVADGPFFRLTNAATTRQYLFQLDASNNIDYWYYNGSTWTQTISLLNNGGAIFTGNVTINNSSGNFGAEAILKGTTSTGTPKSEIAFKRGTSGDGANMVLRTSDSSGTIQDVLTLDTGKNSTFAGSLTGTIATFNTGVGNVGLGVYTSGESTTPNVRFGRDGNQYIGFKVTDRVNTIVFRQDEGTGDHSAHLDLWTSTTGNKYFNINENDQNGNLISNWLSIKNGNVGIGQSPYSYSRLSTEGSDNTSSNYSFIAYSENTNAILACRNDGQVTMPSGNVGIGVASPSSKLQVGDGTTNVNVKVFGNSTSGIQIHTASGNIAALEQYFGNEGSLWLRLNSVNKVLLRANGGSYFNGGDVGIGTTGPTRKLDVQGPIKAGRVTKNVYYYSTTVSASSQYFHIKTNVSANTQTCMHTWHIQGYAYGSQEIIDCRLAFHTDSSGNIYGKSYLGSLANNIYKSSDGYVVLVFGTVNTYYTHWYVDLFEGMYTTLNSIVLAATYSSTNSGFY